MWDKFEGYRESLCSKVLMKVHIKNDGANTGVHSHPNGIYGSE